MKKEFRITFYSLGTMVNNSRLSNLIKNQYWQAGKEPDDWENFDGDIEIKRLQDRGGDCFLLSMTDAWFLTPTLIQLYKDRNVRSIEIKINNEFHKFRLGDVNFKM